MLIPYSTDAPLYHLPLATGGLIIVNVLVFVLQILFPDQAEYYILQFGIIQPAQWVTNIFMHGGVMHLLGNMLFLWAFGLIVEGKVGWWRLLLIYFCCGVFESGLTQILMVFFTDEGGALGASGAIAGLMLVALVWAPENTINILLVLIFCFVPLVWSFEVSVLMLVFFYMAWDFLAVWLSGFQLSGSMLHLFGAVPGGVIAVWMIKKNYVNCEGYDLLSTWAGRRGKDPGPTEAEKQTIVEQKKRERLEQQQRLREAVTSIQQYVIKGHFELAVIRYDQLRKNKHGIKIPDQIMLVLIDGLARESDTRDRAIRLMEDYVARYESNRSAVALNLARLYDTHQARPRKALRLMQTIDVAALSSAQKQFMAKTIRDCQRKIDAGTIEPIE